MERRFRTTVWPGTLPPVTRVETLGPYYLDGDLLKLDLDKTLIRTIDLPDELYLRELRDFDFDNDASIVDFTNRYGRLGHFLTQDTKNEATHQRLEPDPPAVDRQRIMRLLGATVPDESKLDWDAWYHEVTTHPRMQEWGLFETGLIIGDGMQHVDAFRAWVDTFRSMADIYDLYLSLQADSEAVMNLASVLTILLSPFSPTVQVRHDWDLDEDFDPFENTYPRLENILALQLYRHIAAGDSYLRCENEPCGRLFVHQRGRAKSGQYRGIGVKYCSKNCAKAQVERERRRRQRKNKPT
jgi:hypothetical protein